MKIFLSYPGYKPDTPRVLEGPLNDELISKICEEIKNGFHFHFSENKNENNETKEFIDLLHKSNYKEILLNHLHLHSYKEVRPFLDFEDILCIIRQRVKDTDLMVGIFKWFSLFSEQFNEKDPFWEENCQKMLKAVIENGSSLAFYRALGGLSQNESKPKQTVLKKIINDIKKLFKEKGSQFDITNSFFEGSAFYNATFYIKNLASMRNDEMLEQTPGFLLEIFNNLNGREIFDSFESRLKYISNAFIFSPEGNTLMVYAMKRITDSICKNALETLFKNLEEREQLDPIRIIKLYKAGFKHGFQKITELTNQKRAKECSIFINNFRIRFESSNISKNFREFTEYTNLTFVYK